MPQCLTQVKSSCPSASPPSGSNPQWQQRRRRPKPSADDSHRSAVAPPQGHRTRPSMLRACGARRWLSAAGRQMETAILPRPLGFADAHLDLLTKSMPFWILPASSFSSACWPQKHAWGSESGDWKQMPGTKMCMLSVTPERRKNRMLGGAMGASMPLPAEADSITRMTALSQAL